MPAHLSRDRSFARSFAAFILVGCTLLSLNCFNDSLDPVLPSWDVEVTVPLVNRTYTLLEIVRKDSSILRTGVGGQIIYSLSEPLQPTALGDLISLSLPDTARTVKFGTFGVASAELTLPVAIPWLPPGVTTPIPDTTIHVGVLRDTIPSFQQVTFAQGTISLTITNNLPVPMEVVGPIVLVNEQNETVATFTFNPPGIPPNSSRTASDDLAGKTLDNVLQLSGAVFHTPGSPTPVTLPTGSPLVFTIATNNLRAREAVLASIPPQRLLDNDTVDVPLDDSTLVKEIRIRSGAFTLGFQSNIHLDMVFKYRFVELEQPSGGGFIPYEDSVFLPANGSGQKVVNLANHRIVSRTPNAIRSMMVISSVILPTGSTSPVTVHDTDKVFISMDGTLPVVADSIIGVLKPTWLNVSKSVRVNFGSLPTRFNGQLNIPSASLGLVDLSHFDFPLDMYLRIGARRNATGDSVFLYVPASSRRLQPGQDSIAFDATEVGQFLSQISGSMPDSLKISGRVLVNPPDAYNPNVFGHVGSHTAFAGQLHLEMPMMLGIVAGTFLDTLSFGDTTGDGRRDFNLDKERLKSVNYGKLYIEIENAMPLQAGLGMHLLRSNRESLLRLPQSGIPVTVTAASINEQGEVTAPARSNAILELSEQDVRQFDPAEFLSYAIGLQTTSGNSAVRFLTTDYIKVRVWSRLSYRVNR